MHVRMWPNAGMAGAAAQHEVWLKDYSTGEPWVSASYHMTSDQ